MSMQVYYLVFYPLPEKFWELSKPSYKKVLTSPVIELFVSLLTDKHQFNNKKAPAYINASAFNILI